MVVMVWAEMEARAVTVLAVEGVGMVEGGSAVAGKVKVS